MLSSNQTVTHATIATTRLYDRRQSRPEESPTFKCEGDLLFGIPLALMLFYASLRSLPPSGRSRTAEDVTSGRGVVRVVHQAKRYNAMQHVIVSRNDHEEVWVATPRGKILAECFFKAEDETSEELRQMGYRPLTEQYRRAHITIGAGLEADDLPELFVDA